MGVNSLPKTVTRQRRGCDLNPGPSATESSTLTTRLPSPMYNNTIKKSSNLQIICPDSLADIEIHDYLPTVIVTLDRAARSASSSSSSSEIRA